VFALTAGCRRREGIRARRKLTGFSDGATSGAHVLGASIELRLVLPVRGCRPISDGWMSAHGTCLGRAVRPRASIYRGAPLIKCAARPLTRVRGAPTGVFSEPLATACHGFEALLNVPERSRTVGNFPQVDGPSERLSAFGHGHAGRVRQVTD